MIFNILILLVLNMCMVSSYSYLNNNISSYNLSQLEIDFWFDSPLTGYHNSYPPVGINCIVSTYNYSYFISSQSLLARKSIADRCQSQKRTVSIFKKNMINSITEQHIVLGETYSGSNIYKCYRWNEEDMHRIESLVQADRYNMERKICTRRGFYWKDDMIPTPTDCYCGCCQKIIHPVGGKGSDDVTSCGIDSTSNILYYIGGNYQNCPDNYNTQPSIVRINLTNFEFIDRTYLYNIDGYNNYGNWSDFNILKEYMYFNYPSCSILYNGKLLLSFNSDNSGIWEINIRSSKVTLDDSFQKKIFYIKTEIEGNTTKQVHHFNYLSHYSQVLYNEINNLIYFISDSTMSNAKVIVFNMSDTNYFSKHILVELSGINNIKDIKIDYIKKNIYLLSGQLSSKLYKFNYSFSLIPISTECNINSINFPVDWKNANSMVLDDITGILYLFFVTEPYTGFSVLKVNTMEYSSIIRLYFNRNNFLFTPQYIEVVEINRNLGKIIVANRANENSVFPVYGEINLLGCAQGKRHNLNKCSICPHGTFTDSIGKKSCKLCNIGYSTIKDESTSCILCNKGRYADILGSSSCLACPTGKFVEIEGSIICLECDAGKYNIKLVSISPTDCLECEEGKYSETSSSRCISCKIGEYVYNKKKCNKCPTGKFSEIVGITTEESCNFCQMGKYNSIIGGNSSKVCLNCPIGMYSFSLGGIDSNGCISCEAGRYKEISENRGTACKLCSNGQYSMKGSSLCILCKSGKYNNGFKSIDHITCKKCSPGTFSNIIGADNINKCTDCPLGKFSSKVALNNSNGCNSCMSGRYNDIIGSTSNVACIKCPEGKIREFIGGTSINDCINCPVGFFSKINTYFCSECRLGQFNNNNGNSKCTICNPGKYANTTKSIICKECPDNSETNIVSTYCECIKGTYIVNSNPLVCHPCPDNFDCPKGSTIETIVVKKAFWRTNASTLHAYRCKKGYNCPGGFINKTSDDLCNVGHTGPICDVCIDGWAKNDGKCFKCMTDNHVIVRSYSFTILFPLIISGIIFFMIKTANPSSSTDQKEPLSGVIKIFMNYAQIFTLASSFEINWPEIVLNLFDKTKEFSSPRISFYSSDCTIGWGYYEKLLGYLLLPLGYIIIITIILSMYSFSCYKKNRIKRINKNKWRNINHKEKFFKNNPDPIVFFKSWMYTSILIGLFLAWPTIIKQGLSIIPCKLYGDKYYLLEDLSVECYTPQHYIYSIISCIFLVIYGFIIPFISFNTIRMKRFSLNDFTSKYEMPAPLSFLFLGYRENVWYYEFIVMAKKYSLIIITVFLKEYSRYQMISASLFIQVAFFIHVFLRPYDSITNYGILCNKLESISLLALVVTLNSGLFFGTIEDQYKLGSFELVLIVALFMMNAIVVLYFLYYLIKLSINEFIDILKKTIKKLDKQDSCCIKCISKDRRKQLVKWSKSIDLETFGIRLKSNEEIELFHYFFNDKKMFSARLKEVLKDGRLAKFSNILNRIRKNIEIIEKQRCWLAILNNRLYKSLRLELIKKKDKLDAGDISKLNGILNNYIKSGLRYSKAVDRISEKALVTIKRKSVVSMTTELKNIYEDTSDSDTSIDSPVEKVENIKNIII